MNSFKEDNTNLKFPVSAVWQMNTISEYKGKEDLYFHQSPQILNALVEMAIIESAESSNRIEGVTVDKDRLKPLLINHSRPRDRSEEELAGYRKALELIHKKHSSIKIQPETILKFHRLCRYETGDAGQWKSKDNEIIKKHPDGRVEIIFRPTMAKETPDAVEQLCINYRHSLDNDYPPLYSIACLVLDFLCIHPFRDGNGRVARLLTLLALYQNDFNVGKYISMERIIEQNKEEYYSALNKSSQKWHESKHNIMPWFHYFLSTVLTAYKELEERAVNVVPKRGAKTEIISDAILKQSGDFTLAEIKSTCPGISHDMIRLIFKRLKEENKIICLGKGKSAKWRVK